MGELRNVGDSSGPATAGRLTAILAALLALCVNAQAPERSAMEVAPIDLTGYWAALITDDWQYRMIVPARGDYSWVPLNAEGRRVADTWDPERDEAAGEACKGYAAPAIMRLPTRLHITWENADTLRVETDTGSQTRLFHFNQPQPQGARTWQGHSVARWLYPGAGQQAGAFRNDAVVETSGGGSLQVDTSYLRPGYLRRNGVPYSEDAFMTEFFNVLTGAGGEQYLAIQTFVDDPVYLTQHFMRTLQFKREPDGSMWQPTQCSADGWAEN